MVWGDTVGVTLCGGCGVGGRVCNSVGCKACNTVQGSNTVWGRVCVTLYVGCGEGSNAVGAGSVTLWGLQCVGMEGAM